MAVDRVSDGCGDLDEGIRRRRDRVSLDPVGDTFVAWTPTVENGQWQDYLTTLEKIADERRSDLGRQAATDAPDWAVEALGSPPSPDRAEDRAW